MAFNPDEPRDSHGRWTEGGAGASESVDPRVVDVGGGDWNKETAARLEKEYAAQRPALDKMAHDAVEEKVEVTEPASDWDSVSGGIQESAKEDYVSSNLESEVENAIQNWQEEGGGLHDAAYVLAEDEDWKHEQLEEMIKDRDENEQARIPYSIDQLADAVKITPPEYSGYKDDEKEPGITFDDSKLQAPDNQMSPDQLPLPGIDAPKMEDSLTQDMRDAITEHLTSNFKDEAEKKSSSMDAPDYITEGAKESLESLWDDNMDDEQKYSYTKEHTSLLEEENQLESGTVTFPRKFDPLNETTGADYKATQKMARYLQTERAAQLLEQKGIKALGWTPVGQTTRGPNDEKMILKDGKWEVAKDTPGGDPVHKDDIATANRSLWEGWKGDSANEDGKLIQAAAHEEFGGRLNTTRKGISLEASKDYANTSSVYKAVGGYDGVKALLRATWETTQYMLDRANVPTLELYRGLKLGDLTRVALDTNTGTPNHFMEISTGKTVPHEIVDHNINVSARSSDYISKTSFTKLPELPIMRNGSESWTTDAKVANEWSLGEGHKVTLRSEAPRTSVLSVPAFGINEFSEHEVVLLGTALKHWDVWSGHAPKISAISLKPHVEKALPKQHKTAAEKEHFA